MAGRNVDEEAGDWSQPTKTTHTHAADTTEQTVVERATLTKPEEVVLLLDLTNLTQSITIRVYEKIGGNYRIIDPTKSWTTSDVDGIRVNFKAQSGWKVTIQSGTAEAAQRSIPYDYSLR